MRSDSSQSSQGSVWTMLVVVMISIPIVWELFQRNENTGLRTLRLLAAIVAIVCLASAAYIKEYLARRELAFHFGLASDQLRLAMQASTSVAWEPEAVDLGHRRCLRLNASKCPGKPPRSSKFSVCVVVDTDPAPMKSALLNRAWLTVCASAATSASTAQMEALYAWKISAAPTMG